MRIELGKSTPVTIWFEAETIDDNITIGEIYQIFETAAKGFTTRSNNSVGVQLDELLKKITAKPVLQED